MSCPCDQIEIGKQPGCPCDIRVHPVSLRIPAGLSRLPRQMATFPEFRTAMLGDLKANFALRGWRVRDVDDLGLMLLEMWAYVCDSLSFYDEVIANELYLRTAVRRPSLRRLVQVLGYLPRPAIAAQAWLATFADGRQPCKLPAGTAFRSGAFEGNPPQVFELDFESNIHPFFNKWPIKYTIPSKIGVENPDLLFMEPKAELKEGMLVLLTDASGTIANQAAMVVGTEAHASVDGRVLRVVHFQKNLEMPKHTPLVGLRLLTPSQSAGLKTGSSPTKSNGAITELLLDGIHGNIYPGEYVIVSEGQNHQWYQIKSVAEVQTSAGPSKEVGVTPKGGSLQTYTVSGQVLTTKLVFEKKQANVGVVSAASFGMLEATVSKQEMKLHAGVQAVVGHSLQMVFKVIEPAANDFARSATIVHFGLREAGKITRPPSNVLEPGLASHIPLATEVEIPATPPEPLNFFLEDKNKMAVDVKGKLLADTNPAYLKLTDKSLWIEPLELPAEVFGNRIGVSRGEKVENEILGSGDATVSSQSFKLKKKPLTYLFAPTADNDQGVKNTLKVYVNGILWSEVANFYGAKENDQIYVVRQDDEGNSWLSFGDGKRGQRLPSGRDNVVAHYRFGAGIAAPPAGSINQIGKPVLGLQSVKNPLPAFGGAEAETPEQLRDNAPKSALLLGRAVSIQDIEAATLTLPGVRAATATWRWHGTEQRAVVHVLYIGDEGIESLVKSRLQAISEDAVPIRVERAIGLDSILSIDIQRDPRYVEKDVLAAVRLALTNTRTGILAPERIGIGRALFRSQIFDAVLDVPGAAAVSGLYLNESEFVNYGLVAGVGKYFDFDTGTLLLNGKASEA